MIQKLNVVNYTSIELGGLLLPLKIDIANIKEVELYEIPLYKTTVIENNTISTSDNGFPDFFYGKFREKLQICFILETIYDFIDIASMNKVGYLIKLFPNSKEQFVNNILESNIQISAIQSIYSTILNLMELTKTQFLTNVIEILNIDKKYPEIKLKDDLSDSKTYKANKKHLELTYDFITMQSIIEYNPYPLFQENINKGSLNYSWREKELRRLYIKAKTDYDSFYELLKSKMTEEFREATIK